MAPSGEWVIPLAEAAGRDEGLIGGKAAKLAKLTHAGFRVPDGFCLPAAAYEHFVAEADLVRVIRAELGRKPFDAMRWEEIWDAALRIRSAYLSTPIPAELAASIGSAVERLGPGRPLAVRSSAPGEDSARRSFAGLHESVVGVTGKEAVLEAVRVVWASLWSDAALLYRQELGLDPALSRMAVLVQALVDEDRSGVAFGRDPRDPALDRAIVEAVPGPCGDLVDGLVDPDRWILRRSSGEVLEWRPGVREEGDEPVPILEAVDLENVHGVLLTVEALFRWPPDIEWTGQGERFRLLQARPITTAAPEGGDSRNWYLSLRPGRRRLAALAQRVAGELIPELEEVGRRLAAEPIEEYDNGALAAAIEARYAAVERWRQTYLDDFIPFAHGVRQLGTYYNDAVRPDDPYEFVGLLRGQRLVASQRNQDLRQLAQYVREEPALGEVLRRAADGGRVDWPAVCHALQALPGGDELVQRLEALRTGMMDVAYGSERLSDRPDLLVRTLLEMVGAADRLHQQRGGAGEAEATVAELEARLLAAVGQARHEQALEVLGIGRLSWRLRDDDNVLVGRLESQLLRALNLAVGRLRSAGRLGEPARVTIGASPVLAEALRDPGGCPVDLPAEPSPGPIPRPGDERESAGESAGESPRQLVGQPASPGLASGRVRVVRSTDDLGLFRAGEVLVCDAIQPTMTHLVPLAAAVVERRGGMLIHGAIIARELGVPCVNGVARAAELLEDGTVVTVDGYLGIVTVGPPEFDLEIGVQA